MAEHDNDFLPPWFQFWLGQVEEPRHRKLEDDMRNLASLVTRIDQKLDKQEALATVSERLSNSKIAKWSVRAAVAAPIVALLALIGDVILRVFFHVS